MNSTDQLARFYGVVVHEGNSFRTVRVQFATRRDAEAEVRRQRRSYPHGTPSIHEFAEDHEGEWHRV